MNSYDNQWSQKYSISMTIWLFFLCHSSHSPSITQRNIQSITPGRVTDTSERHVERNIIPPASRESQYGKCIQRLGRVKNTGGNRSRIQQMGTNKQSTMSPHTTSPHPHPINSTSFPSPTIPPGDYQGII